MVFHIRFGHLPPQILKKNPKTKTHREKFDRQATDTKNNNDSSLQSAFCDDIINSQGLGVEGVPWGKRGCEEGEKYKAGMLQRRGVLLPAGLDLQGAGWRGQWKGTTAASKDGAGAGGARVTGRDSGHS